MRRSPRPGTGSRGAESGRSAARTVRAAAHPAAVRAGSAGGHDNRGMKFDGELFLNGKTATGIRVPDDVVAELGGGKRPAVRVTLRHHTYRTTIAPMGGEFWIPVSAEQRDKAGVAAGDKLAVTVELDDAPRVVEVPDDLGAALGADRAATAFYETLSFTNQRQYVEWVTSAKKPETRADRIVKTMEALRAGKKTR